jgi:hypothetical protein
MSNFMSVHKNHVTKAYRGDVGKAPLVLILAWHGGGQLHALADLNLGYPLSEPQSCSG